MSATNFEEKMTFYRKNRPKKSKIWNDHHLLHDYGYKDLCEYIDSNGHTIYDKPEKAAFMLHSISASIRLDLHGVVDITPVDFELFSTTVRKNNKIVVISFVGKYGEIRKFARDEIKTRIAAGQVDCGILVFQRGARRTEQRNNCFAEGSKAWANDLINHEGKCIFIDDSPDHVNSVINKQIEGMHAYRFSGQTHELEKLLSDLTKEHF